MSYILPFFQEQNSGKMDLHRFSATILTNDISKALKDKKSILEKEIAVVIALKEKLIHMIKKVFIEIFEL